MWVRFNLISAPPRRSDFISTWQHHADQRLALQQLVVRTLDKRCYAALGEPDMKRMVRLFKKSFGRRRHPQRLRELLQAGDEASEDLVFTVVKKSLS